MKKTAKRSLPRVFIGSSDESVDEAYAIQANLENDAEITVWPQGIFDLSRSNLDSLLRAVSQTDFGIFVLSATDTIRLRRKEFLTARDNVVLELGLFLGKLGPQRTFFVVPKGIPDFRIPSDLAGITTGRYDPKRRDKNLFAALGPFCHQVRVQLRRLGPIARKRRSATGSTGSLVIYSAVYGVGGSVVDVRAALKSRLRDNILAVCVGNHLAGDPAPGVPKRLTVEYSYNGKRRTVNVLEGGELRLPDRSR